MTAADEFRNVIARAGMTPPDVIEPDRFHRFAGIGKRNGNTAGWCKLFADGMGGIYGDFAQGVTETWQVKRERPASLAEREAFREHIARAKAEAEAARRKAQEDAAQRAQALWTAAVPATSHPYAEHKSVGLHGLRVHGDELLVPMRDADGKLWDVQRIAADGIKHFLKDGRVTGCYHAIGKPNATVCICEGYATGASVYEAMGHAVAIAFNKGNLLAVARVMREKFPNDRIIICADDDYRTEGNPGIAKATEAARTVAGLVALPDFGEERPEGATDFNDLAQHRGAEAVRRAVEAASSPDVGSSQPSADHGANGQEWPDPQPLPEALQAVEAFTLELLPEALRPWISDIAERVQCPPDFPAVAAMVALGSVLGRKVAMFPKRQDIWHEYPNLWGAIVGRPGVLKSPALRESLRPLRELERDAAEAYGVAMDTWNLQRIEADVKRHAGVTNARQAARKGGAFDPAELVRHDPGEEPAMRRFVVNDCSVEGSRRSSARQCKWNTAVSG